MILYHLILLCLVKYVFSGFISHYDNNLTNNELACPYDRACVPVDYCPGVERLMNQNALPVHRFRLAICGYEGTTPKICCSPSKDPNPSEIAFRGLNHRQGIRSECGRPLLPNNLPSVSLGSFPFLARIGFVNLNTGETKYACTGTIINSRTILTTATCALAQSDKYKLQYVLVGEFDTAKDPDCDNLFCGHKPSCQEISYVVKHPGFEAETFTNNIALIRLQEPINFTATVQPACIYTGREFNLMEMDQALLFGWGKLSSETNPTTELRTLDMRLVSGQECIDFWNQGLCVELCVIGEQQPCTGFSGSPLVRMNGNKFTVIGILSYGAACDDNRNSPVAFVDVKKYADWIAQN